VSPSQSSWDAMSSVVPEGNRAIASVGRCVGCDLPLYSGVAHNVAHLPAGVVSGCGLGVGWCVSIRLYSRHRLVLQSVESMAARYASILHLVGLASGVAEDIRHASSASWNVSGDARECVAVAGGCELFSWRMQCCAGLLMFVESKSTAGRARAEYLVLNWISPRLHIVRRIH
jgi:hypothetical protein